MAKAKSADKAPAEVETAPGLNTSDEATAFTLGDQPAEAFQERSGDETNVNPSADTSPDIDLAKLEAEAMQREEAERLIDEENARKLLSRTDPVPMADPIGRELPYWHVTANCSTPIAFPEVLLQAQNEQDAEAEFRRMNGLYGSIAGGLRIAAHVPQ